MNRAALIDQIIETNQPGPRLAADAGNQDTDAQQVADALQQWAGSVGGFGDAATAIVSILIEAKGSSVADQSQKASDAFAQKFPNYAKAANFVFFAAWVGGIFQVLVTFIDKKPLSPTDIASGVNSCVDLVNRAVGGVADFFSGKFTLPKSYALNSAMSQEVELDTFRDSTESLSGSDEETALFSANGPQKTVYGTIQGGEVSHGRDELGEISYYGPQGSSWNRARDGRGQRATGNIDVRRRRKIGQACIAAGSGWHYDDCRLGAGDMPGARPGFP